MNQEFKYRITEISANELQKLISRNLKHKKNHLPLMYNAELQHNSGIHKKKSSANHQKVQNPIGMTKTLETNTTAPLIKADWITKSKPNNRQNNS